MENVPNTKYESKILIFSWNFTSFFLPGRSTDDIICHLTNTLNLNRSPCNMFQFIIQRFWIKLMNIWKCNLTFDLITRQVNSRRMKFCKNFHFSFVLFWILIPNFFFDTSLSHRDRREPSWDYWGTGMKIIPTVGKVAWCYDYDWLCFDRFRQGRLER